MKINDKIMNENPKNNRKASNSKNNDLSIKQIVFKKEISDSVTSISKINQKKGKGNSTIKNNYKLKKYLEEKSSERNAFDNYSHNSENKLNLEVKDFNNKSIISQETENENNGKEIENIYFRKKKRKSFVKSSETYKNTPFDKDIILSVKNNKKNNIKEKINNDFNNNIFDNKSFSYIIKVNAKEEKNIYKCLFCEKISSDEKYNSLFTCPHFFCVDCGRNFYEEVIDFSINYEDFESNMKCPLMKCKNKVSLTLLERILPDNYYTYIKELLGEKFEKIKHEKRNGKMEINILKTDYVSEKNEKRKTYNDSIINVNNHDQFTNIIKKTFILCINCKKYSLYDNIYVNYNLCLNCLKKYCKYCNKLYEKRHYEITYKNHCRVVYRRFKDFSNSNCFKKYLFSLLFVIAGYLYLLTMFLVQIKRLSRIKCNLFNIIKATSFFVLFIVFLPVVLIIFPYFPIIASI